MLNNKTPEGFADRVKTQLNDSFLRIMELRKTQISIFEKWGGNWARVTRKDSAHAISINNKIWDEQQTFLSILSLNKVYKKSPFFSPETWEEIQNFYTERKKIIDEKREEFAAIWPKLEESCIALGCLNKTGTAYTFIDEIPKEKLTAEQKKALYSDISESDIYDILNDDD